MNATNFYKKAASLILALLIGIVLYFLVRALDQILASYFLPESKDIYFQAKGSALSIFTISFNGIIYPFIEEFVFRRKLYSFLSRRFKNWSPIVLTAAIFCLVHVELYGTLYMINIFLLGLVCQKLANSSGSIVTSAACHGAFNICVLAPKRSVADVQLALGISELNVIWFAGIVALLATAIISVLLRGVQTGGALVSIGKSSTTSGG